MATIKDVARLAGVSTTTVSHVINKTRFVAEATQEKVKKAVDELNYAPSAVARSLKCNTTRTIGMLVTQSSNPFFAEVVDGVESYCYRQGYTLILCNTGGIYEKQRDYIRMLAEKRVDGILVMCSDLTEDLREMLDAHASIPKVIMDWGPESSQADKIIDNSEEGGYLATKYLLENGHTDIACLTGHEEKVACIERVEGYKRALNEFGVEFNQERILVGNFECDTAVIAADKILAMDKRPTAVFCFNDLMALGVISRLQENGLRVPDDISIIGYDNIELSGYFSPPLTTVHQPKRRVGKTAFEILLQRIKDKEHDKRIFEMHPEIIERSSVKKLN
ncbi:HTH-type transcriptional repressor purR [Vibrio nigripulchritudo MADA3029]|jgi:LacI family purine nucleotide synthesis repressor|uniref:HTH-type transcriptional repressor PurR n=2 Tax=Vibrio nigripulchritudo TaxID=28173 RepID=U4JZ04_9VIBR|nr:MULTISPECIES: HTH-type transcriptional repressor PurR [Vibrio]EGU60353.1 HTH-type transcriptional repressor PurR [Vibrio nigripulchritudo ATCC 27043]UAB69122.1 HTH-type transcriptional repressor PurR [Vibrio sp. SCSIO 43132]CCN33528.1 HTH-type transcriptional repressor purR [Vibrio nigripulchritudo AM115]CCN41533.1 HTH-type transcriptional repressor purR [Vibrio nigripulchritudo FTn2]CCN50417.1 HTH-type transcriptional repressor purR [Vibrio nigripulchritudo MADA3020]